MSTILVRNDCTYQNTCLQIPYELKMKARKQKINFTKTLVRALELQLAEPEKTSVGVATPPSNDNPSLPSRQTSETQEG